MTSSLLQGVPLPQPIRQSTSVPYGNTFLLIGGNKDFHFLDTVYEYVAESGTWKLHPTRLDTPKRNVGAMLVRKESFPTCS